MRNYATLFALGMGLTFAIPSFPALAQLRPVDAIRSQKTLGTDEQLWGHLDQPGDRQELLAAVDRSLQYLQTNGAAEAYRRYPMSSVTLSRVQRSLERFRQLLLTARSAAELQAAVEREFMFYQSVGRDDRGTVYFTGYYEPIYAASLQPTEEYRYPLYRLPEDLSRWAKPHPTRTQLEGRDGTGSGSSLAGSELVWLRDRLEAFLVHIQGSARFQLTDGSTMTVGYAGGTDYPFTSIGREIAKDGKLPLDGLTIPVMIDFFRRHPQDLDLYLPRNNRFIFFRDTQGAPATGSLGVPLTADRSIATDKSLMPPGALALVRTRIPHRDRTGKMESNTVTRYVLDQDTGSAIRGAGRVDLFLGTGPEAGDRAGIVGGTGELYYLLLKE